MKRLLFIMLTALMINGQGLLAKTVKVTIDGTVPPSQTKLYLIINEDTANAQLLTIKDCRFSTTVKVDRDAFIRLHDSKKWPEYSAFVLIPDSKHITVDWNSGAISGSPMSQMLKAACKEIRDSSPEGFHIDVFSEDPEAWRQAREQGNAVRNKLLEQQKFVVRRVLCDKENSILSVWLAYCFPQLFKGEFEGYIDYAQPKWINHPLMQKKR
ncbi:MAG: hypothetical protein IKN22_03860 [Bacteroidaceae bacterium]|nr:hypothetical protein [Bacteroidaceae bacterium]MBR4649716.1 hypothetical protein [Bacteroidaceae bacterium]